MVGDKSENLVGSVSFFSVASKNSTIMGDHSRRMFHIGFGDKSEKSGAFLFSRCVQDFYDNGLACSAGVFLASER